MDHRRLPIVAALLTVLAMVTAACSDDGAAPATTTAPTSSAPVDTSAPSPAPTASSAPTSSRPDSTTGTTAPADGPWRVDVDRCPDPSAATARIEGSVSVAAVLPLTGGVAAAAFAPLAAGLRASIDAANAQDVLGGVQIELTIGDDQYDPQLTPDVVSAALADGADVVSGIAGTPNNMAVRELLNDACVPHLNALTGAPEWGDVEGYPWTTGLLVPYTVEAEAYAAELQRMHPDGATVAVFAVDSEFGQSYVDALAAVAPAFGLEIVDVQRIAASDSDPPSTQLTSIAALEPDAVVAAPVSVGCLSFLTELAAVRSTRPGWAPTTFITSTCASSRLLAAAGPAADGVHTSADLRDLEAPGDEAPPREVQAYVDAMTAAGHEAMIPSGGAGWTLGEVTIEILRRAAESPAGLTRASIIEAARDLTVTPSLGRAGVVYRTDGEADPYLAESLHVVRYESGDDGVGTFVDVGELHTAVNGPTPST